MSIAKFLWRYLSRYTHWGLLALVSILVYASASAAMISLIEPIFGEVLMSTAASGPISVSAAKSEEGEPAEAPELVRKLDIKRHLNESYRSLNRQFGIDPENVIYFLPILFFIVFEIRSLADFLSGYSFQHIGLGATNAMRNDLFQRIVEQSSRFHAEHPSGELVSRVVSDVSVMQNAVSTRILDLFQQSITLVFLVWLLLATQPKLALICLVATPAFLYPIARFGRGMRRTSHRSQERMADLTQLLSEAVRGHRVVKAFGMERFELERFRRATRRHLRVKLRAQILSYASGPVVESIAALGSVAFLIYAGRAVRAEQLSAPVLVQFLTNLLLLYDPIRKLNKVNLIVQEALAAVSRVARVMVIPNDVVERPGAREIDGVRERITFDGVSFAYRDQPVLDVIDLEIRRGEVVALVGRSGAGKSTLVSLLPRFFDPDEGRVTIDGIDIRDLKLASLRRQIALVTQETVLFDDTVRNNIAYGRSELPLETVREAASAAYADQFIMELPEGYDTPIGEGGLQLSGGQRQRLTVARALLKNAPILILDEATSHLDTESEALVQKALHNLMQGRTTLVIAHRLSTVVSAHRIVVIESGRIVETGSHDKLLARRGIYRRLYDMQFRL